MLKYKKNIKSYIVELVNLYPQILSGRKNIEKYEKRLQNNILIIKKFIKKK
tara:strand:- start:201 stop:353 length:153 start_codon:yes stop_codon:yes gene_type:complete